MVEFQRIAQGKKNVHKICDDKKNHSFKWWFNHYYNMWVQFTSSCSLD
jgi:hypothetical protein